MNDFTQCVDIRNNFIHNCIDLHYYENDIKNVVHFNYNWYFIIARNEYDKYKNEILQQCSDKLDKIKLSKNWAKLYCADAKSEVIATCRQLGITLYESDLSITRRFWIDHYKKDWHVAEASKYNILYFDIETDDTTKGLEIGGSRILSWATIDTAKHKHFVSLKTCNDEKELLQKFIKHIANYDIITGWNSHNFDIPYIKARLLLHKLESYISTPHIDMMQRMIHSYRFDTKIRSYSLDYIANHFVGERKVQRDVKIIDMFNNDFETFKNYNIRDVELLLSIDKQCHVFETLLKQLYWCNVFPRDIGPKAKGLYVMLDSIILNKAHQNNIYCPSPILTHSKWADIYVQHAERYKTIAKELKNKELKIQDLFDSEESKKYTIKELQHKLPRANLKILDPYPDLQNVVKQYQYDEAAYFYEGGYVIPPDTGLYPLVYSFDYRSLYPSVIRSFNIGFESLVQEDETDDNAMKSCSDRYFKKTPDSILHVVIKELMEKRKEYKKKLLDIIEQGKTGTTEYEAVHSDEVVVKELANSCYGITGNRTGRYFSKGAIIPRSITLTGQGMLKLAAQFATEKKYTVIYGDTDSIMIATKNEIDVKYYLKEFHKWLSMQLKTQYNVDSHIIELEFDRVYKPFCLISKKAYSGRVLNQEGKKTDYIYSRGIDVIKSSACPIVVKLQSEVIELLIMKNKDEKFFKKWIASVKKNVFVNLKLPDDLIIHQKINKNLHEYKNKPLAAIIAERKLKREGVLVSKEIAYVITGRTTIDSTNSQSKKTVANRLSGVEPEFFEGVYDKQHYWDNIILPCITRFLNVAFPTAKWTEDYNYDAEKQKALKLEKIKLKKEREEAKIRRDKERLQKRKERLELKIKKDKEREKKKKLREKERDLLKKKREKVKLQKEKEREARKEIREKAKQQKEKLKLKKEIKQKNEIY